MNSVHEQCPQTVTHKQCTESKNGLGAHPTDLCCTHGVSRMCALRPGCTHCAQAARTAPRLRTTPCHGAHCAVSWRALSRVMVHSVQCRRPSTVHVASVSLRVTRLLGHVVACLGTRPATKPSAVLRPTRLLPQP